MTSGEFGSAMSAPTLGSKGRSVEMHPDSTTQRLSSAPLDVVLPASLAAECVEGNPPEYGGRKLVNKSQKRLKRVLRIE